MSLSREGALRHRCWRLRAVSPAGVGIRRLSTPDDHFTASPDRRVQLSGTGRVGGAGGCPTVRAGIVPPAGVHFVLARDISGSTPDDHFIAGPDRRVIVPASGRVGSAGGCPTIRAGIVSPAGVHIDIWIRGSTPDDHF